MGSISSPIPLNVVAYVGGLNGNTRSYTLWKDGHRIVIQAPPLPDADKVPWDASESLELVIRLEREYLYDLEHIHNLLPSIEFGKTNWAYMLPNPKGGYNLVQKQKTLYKVRTRTWAPRIEEKELTYIKWILVDVRIGYWKGREVDVILGYEDHYLRRIDATMNGYLLLQGLDITYTVLAHVVHSDGSVIGVVTEPEVGRLVEYRDRALVYDAITRLQERRLIYHGINYSKIHILHGKVRLSNLASVFHIKDSAELAIAAEKRHWKPLEELFKMLEMDPPDQPPQLALERRFKQITIQLLPDHPSPERPRFMRFMLSSHIPEGFAERIKLSKGERSKDGRSRKHGVVYLSAEFVSAEPLEANGADVTDLPLSIQKTRRHAGKGAQSSLQPHNHRPKGLLTG